MAELLAPVGDFDSLKCAVQNGADAVYFGGELFNARASAHNFDDETLKLAIDYAKLRNVKINFTLNTLIKDDEFQSAVELAKYVYDLGADAIIVQDLGLARYIIKNFPDMEVHASTQMSVHNLQGVKELEELGFDRVVLSRELPMNEISYICKNTSTDIEVFVHGAICISYSGQCLFSSIIGGRSANRGKCAQPCRLPYELIIVNGTNNQTQSLDKGYLISAKDQCALEFIPDLIKAGVKSFKIEGRLKPPEYVATCTRIYRKYIDLANSDEEYKVDPEDIKELMLVFNRGGFSFGNFSSKPNMDYVFKEKPSNMGIYIGNISNINSKKEYITLRTNEKLKIGDCFSVIRESHKYTISEMLDKDGNNIRKANPGDTITIGRIKGNLKLGDKVYKLSSNTLQKDVMEYANGEHIKIKLNAKIEIHKGIPMKLSVWSNESEVQTYFSLSTTVNSDVIPEKSINTPLTENRVITQLSKTSSTQFEFEHIEIDMDNDIFLPKISSLNELRRKALHEITNMAISRYERYKYLDNAPSDVLKELKSSPLPESRSLLKTHILTKDNFKLKDNSPKISLLLNNLKINEDYSGIKDVDALYIPIKYFSKKEYSPLLLKLSKNYKLYVVLPTIIRDNYKNIILNNLQTYIDTYKLKGIVITNVAGLSFARKYKGKLEIVARYTLNVFNMSTINELKDAGVSRVVLSPELDEETLINLANNSSLPVEYPYYGRIPLMNIGYCLLGKSNKCYPKCTASCRKEDDRYYLKDRLGFEFPFFPDNLQCVTTIYNSRITSIYSPDLNVDYKQISILDESVDKIKEIVAKVKSGGYFEGNGYTSGNLNKFV